jgi:hypothetical protein
MKVSSIIYEGHAPGAVRGDFLDAVDRMFENGFTTRKLILLCRQLRECTDVLPGVTCELLEIPSGSTYGQAAYALLKRTSPLP